MNIVEALEKYENDSNIAMVIREERGTYTVSAINFSGGVCDCCSHVDLQELREDPNSSDGYAYVPCVELVKVIDTNTMEVLYSKEEE